ncbi:hypothetical protein MMC20_002300 [Loxospora ochrophaea]|nr:hypothetical protein [Loxospora ochrophaea]
MISISDFIEKYRHGRNRYVELEKQVETICKEKLKDQNIKFAWQSRVKEPESLETKLRVRSGKYKNDAHNISDLKDLVAGRILLTRWRDIELVDEILCKNFNIEERTQHPKQMQNSTLLQSRFQGYNARHFHIVCRDSENEQSDNILVEIQIMSLAMSAWSELEHDFGYKKLNGHLSRSMYLTLEAVKGLSNAQEVLLELFENLLDSQFDSLRSQQYTTGPDPLNIMADILNRNQESIGFHLLLKQQEAKRLTDQEQECLQAFRTSNFEGHKARNPDRVNGTCQWFLQHPNFTAWRDSRKPSLLWVSADPGCGKSVLSKSLIDNELRSTTSRTTCYFFFKDDDVDQQNVETALSALLHQLFSQKKNLIRYAMQEYRDNGKKLPQLFNKQWDILTAATSDPRAGEVVCILDALDECKNHGEILISALSQFYDGFARDDGTKKSWLSFLVTSRPYYHIERRFRSLTSNFPTIRLAGEVETESISKEIDLVIKARVQEIGVNLDLNSTARVSLEEELLKSEHRTYLWLHLVLDVVENSLAYTPRELRKLIGQLPSTVDNAYEAILRGSTDEDLAKKLLHIVVSATRPLTLQEMNVALKIEDSHTSVEDLDIEPEKSFQTKVKNLCGLFISVFDSRIYLIHQTAKEFLVSGRVYTNPTNSIEFGNWKHSLNPSKSNLILAKACITYLLFTVFESDSLIPKEEDGMIAYVNQYISRFPFLAYAADYWAAHLREAEVKDGTLIESTAFKICDTRSARFKLWWSIFHLPIGFLSLFDESSNNLSIGSYFGLELVVQLLLEKGASTDSKDSYGETPLSHAASEGHEAVVQLLLEKGASVDSKNEHGQTPLLLAALEGYEAVVRLLLEKGASIDSKDEDGQTPLSQAAFKGHEAVVQLLLEKGANIDSEDNNDQTPLLHTVLRGHEVVVQQLLKKGASVDSKDKYGQTPLSHAASEGHKAVVQLLQQKGASMDSKDKYGQTPLSHTASEGHKAVVQLLLEKGANIDSEDEIGQMPLLLAA